MGKSIKSSLPRCQIVTVIKANNDVWEDSRLQRLSPKKKKKKKLQRESILFKHALQQFSCTNSYSLNTHGPFGLSRIEWSGWKLTYNPVNSTLPPFALPLPPPSIQTGHQVTLAHLNPIKDLPKNPINLSTNFACFIPLFTNWPPHARPTPTDSNEPIIIVWWNLKH